MTLLRGKFGVRGDDREGGGTQEFTVIHAVVLPPSFLRRGQGEVCQSNNQPCPEYHHPSFLRREQGEVLFINEVILNSGYYADNLLVRRIHVAVLDSE